MSDLFVTQIAYAKAEKSMEALIKEYNDPELTPKGKKEALLNCIALSFIGGFRISQDEVALLRQQITELQKKCRAADELAAWIARHFDTTTDADSVLNCAISFSQEFQKDYPKAEL